MIVNLADKEVSFKIVYYGPGLCGKTTNLLHIYSRIGNEKGEMISLANKEDRTIFFDFASFDIGKLGDFSVKFSLYTVPGQPVYRVTRKLVLKGVDGLVFVADSAPKRFKSNLVSMQEMAQYLQEVTGVSIKDVPMVIQYNKRDLPDALPLEILGRINVGNVPTVEAVAVRGEGVMETLNAIINLVLSKYAPVIKGRRRVKGKGRKRKGSRRAR